MASIIVHFGSKCISLWKYNLKGKSSVKCEPGGLAVQRWHIESFQNMAEHVNEEDYDEDQKAEFFHALQTQDVLTDEHQETFIDRNWCSFEKTDDWTGDHGMVVPEDGDKFLPEATRLHYKQSPSPSPPPSQDRSPPRVNSIFREHLANCCVRGSLVSEYDHCLKCVEVSEL